MIPLKPGLILLITLLFVRQTALSQACTTLGQTPSTAFPVCGTSTFNQSSVPICGQTTLFVPGCSGTNSGPYQDKNPFWYKFTCFQSGKLSFTITPANLGDDYDWQLYDITGHNPNDVFTDNSLVVTANWSGTFGLTGASASGVTFIQCGSIPSENRPTFAASPDIIVGHEYLLMVSHFTDSQSGYGLAFNTPGSGGTAVITDPKLPHMQEAAVNCDGRQITVKLNKRMKCSSLSATGSEFSILPGLGTITSVTTNNCSTGFDFDELTITLASPLPTNTYRLIINSGSDNNSVLDNCDRNIPAGEQLIFNYAIPQPIFADSIGKSGCAPDEVKIYFPKKINCNTANANDFIVTGPTPVTVISATGDNCVNGQSRIITVRFATPIYTKGPYQLTLRAGTDGTTVIDECGIEAPQHSLPFTVPADTVSAAFTYNVDMDCRTNAVQFLHDGAHDVNTWKWNFNNTQSATTPSASITFPATSTNSVQLIVSNGVCSDTVNNTIVFDNEVIAAFEMPDVICPEDALVITNTSSGLIDQWQWNFDVAGTSNLEDPPAINFPYNNIESYYTIRLLAANNTLGCADSLKKRVRVLNNCFIAVPTAFTPNGDGLNDYLYPNNALKAQNLRFTVYNRWGQVVFNTRNWQLKWDGKINGVTQATGVYVWTLEYTLTADPSKKIFQKGTTTLIR
jgi:gliding motility-associated-like protein